MARTKGEIKNGQLNGRGKVILYYDNGNVSYEVGGTFGGGRNLYFTF